MSLDGRALGPLIGRSEDLTHLAPLTGVDSGSQPGVVLLTGDAGIGKTRLLTALAGRAREHGWLAGWSASGNVSTWAAARCPISR